jgi:hypothetical protein
VEKIDQAIQSLIIAKQIVIHDYDLVKLNIDLEETLSRVKTIQTTSTKLLMEKSLEDPTGDFSNKNDLQLQPSRTVSLE